jgi:hypothetical protein
MKNYNSFKLALNIANSVHGSGIDSDWILSSNGKKVYLNNSYHVMNDDGYYDGYMDFKITIYKGRITRINFVGLSSYHRYRYADLIMDYLNDLFFDLQVFPYNSRPYYLRTR